jgi:uncharacterized membrane protein YqaE (UPF0057 family)
MKLIRLLIGLVLPPVGVAMTVGIGIPFLINLLLTTLGWLPGSIHAVWLIAKHDEQFSGQNQMY